MAPNLSIIIPCYNCSKTLEQAVQSCYAQGLEERGYTYEIIMVDDASTDDTREVMKRLAQGKSNVKVLYHEKNKGGGATRNTAVRNCSADIVFCLDSDDVLGDGTLSKMLTLMLEKKSDGVGVHYSKKFSGNDINKIEAVNTFGYVNQQVPFDSLLEKTEATCPLYSTFMFTKQAFEIAGGYAEDHGFDTQSFAWRFLGNGLVSYTCPDAVYFHRINFHKSYYLREYESGKINHNWFKIFQEFLFVFNEETQMEILNFNLNNPDIQIAGILKKENVLKANYQDYVKNHSQSEYEKYLLTQPSPTTGDLYWLGVKKFKDGKFAEAYDIFDKLVSGGLQNGYAHYYLKLSSDKIDKKSSLIDQGKIDNLFSFSKHGSQLNFFVRAFRKILRILKK